LLQHVQLKYDYRLLAQSYKPLVLFEDSKVLLRLPAGVRVSLRVTRPLLRYPSEIFTLAKGIRKSSLLSEKLRKRGFTVSIDVYDDCVKVIEHSYLRHERVHHIMDSDKYLFRLRTSTLENSALENLVREAYKKIDVVVTAK
jgi:hypothetical protein